MASPRQRRQHQIAHDNGIGAGDGVPPHPGTLPRRADGNSVPYAAHARRQA